MVSLAISDGVGYMLRLFPWFEHARECSLCVERISKSCKALFLLAHSHDMFETINV